jgi:hypothetical protein
MDANRQILNSKFETRIKFKAPKGEILKTPKLWLVERAVDLFRTEELNRECTPMDANGCALGLLCL